MTAQARNADESKFMLQEALMSSNADYNKFKKKMNQEEMDRADQWAERGEQAIAIDTDATNRNHSNLLDPEQEPVYRPRDVSSTDAL